MSLMRSSSGTSKHQQADTTLPGVILKEFSGVVFSSSLQAGTVARARRSAGGGFYRLLRCHSSMVFISVHQVR